MRVLVVTPQPPAPAVHGAAMRNAGLIAALARKHVVDVITLAMPEDLSAPAIEGAHRLHVIRERPRPGLARLRNAAIGQCPDLLYRHSRMRLRGAVQHRLVAERYDTVHIEGLQLAFLIHDVRATFAGAGWRPAIVYDAHNVESQLQEAAAQSSTGLRAQYARRQARLIRAVESWAVSHVDLVLASSVDDAKVLASNPSAAPAVHIPHPVPISLGARTNANESATPRVLLAANFAYRPNIDGAIWFFGSVWPRVVQAVPEAELHVTGPRSPMLRPYAPARCHLGGIVTDIQAEHREAWLAVSPVSVGAGAPYKVLQAYASACPLVVRRSGLRGLDEAAHGGLAITEGRDDFAEAIVELLRDRERRRRMGRIGRAYVRAAHAPSVVARLLANAYRVHLDPRVDRDAA